VITLVEPADAAEWLRMRKALWPDCPEEMHRLEIAEQSGEYAAVFVYRRENGKLGGFIELSIRDRVDGAMSQQVAYIEGWYVDEDLRGRGVGRQLIARGEDWARSQRLSEIGSDAEIENEGSIRAHAALGYRETFRLVHFLKPL
jgi:aminoglycoside 6'-N-acetyltransferase I